MKTQWFHKEVINAYREIFNDFIYNYLHVVDIHWYLTQIMKRPIDKLSESEAQIRLFIETFEN